MKVVTIEMMAPVQFAPVRRCVLTPDHLKIIHPLAVARSLLTASIKGIDTHRGVENANGTSSSRYWIWYSLPDIILKPPNSSGFSSV